MALRVSIVNSSDDNFSVSNLTITETTNGYRVQLSWTHPSFSFNTRYKFTARDDSNEGFEWPKAEGVYTSYAQDQINLTILKTYNCLLYLQESEDKWVEICNFQIWARNEGSSGLDGVELDITSASIKKGDTLKLTLSLKGGSSFLSIDWESSNTNIAKVSGDDTLTGTVRSPINGESGVFIITVRVIDVNHVIHSAMCVVTVVPAELTKWEWTQIYDLSDGSTGTICAEAYIPVYGGALRPVTATEWNNFIEKVNAATGSSLITVSPDDTFATAYQLAVLAIKNTGYGVQLPTTYPVVLNAQLFLDLADALNEIIGE